jgi:hypothetical protein
MSCTYVFRLPSKKESQVPDLVFVLLTVGPFAVLALLVRGVERL